MERLVRILGRQAQMVRQTVKRLFRTSGMFAIIYTRWLVANRLRVSGCNVPVNGYCTNP